MAHATTDLPPVTWCFFVVTGDMLLPATSILGLER